MRRKRCRRTIARTGSDGPRLIEAETTVICAGQESARDLADELHARGRVVAIRGDFTVDGVLRELASVLEAHGLRIEVLYLSNIEQYLAYRKPFRANMLALPLAEDALVLRTLPGKPAGFHYFLQSGDDFLAWMRESRGSTVYRMVGKAKGDPPLTANERVVLTGRPDDPPAEG